MGAHQEIEMILTRQLADCLALPIFLVNAEGTLLFYNEPAERIFGRRFEETGPLSSEEWTASLILMNDEGTILEPEARPLMIALTQRRPTQATLWIRGWDQVKHRIQTTALPLIGRGDRFLGAAVIFWEVPGG
jgi:PAS domain-containing protein